MPRQTAAQNVLCFKLILICFANPPLCMARKRAKQKTYNILWKLHTFHHLHMISWQFNFEKRLFMYQLKWIQIWQNLNLAKMGVFCTFCVIWKYFYHDLVVVIEIMFTFVPSKGPARVDSSHREAAKTKENAWENLKKCYFLDFWGCLKWVIGNS